MRLADADLHYDVVKKYGRFPERNGLLNRTCTAEEIKYLTGPDGPGWADMYKPFCPGQM